MISRFPFRFGCMLLSLLSVAGVGATAQELRQTVSAAGISAQVRVGPDFQHGGHRVDVTFHQSSSTTSVHMACLSAYRDFTYRLQDAFGHTIPINQSAMAHPPFGESSEAISEFALPKGRPMPSCADFDGNTVDRIAFLSAIYPDLPPGQYTLHMAFTPRDTSQSAPLAPITFTIKQRQGL